VVLQGSATPVEGEGDTVEAPPLGVVPTRRRTSPRTVHRPARRAGRPTPQTRSPQPPAPEPAPPAPGGGGWVLPLAIVSTGSFMAVLDSTIVNVAISRIQGQFGGSTQDVEWISTAYTLVLGIVVPTSAWLGSRFGLQRLYLRAVVIFSIGSALCGLASSLNILIAFRVLQALGGGLMPVLAQTILYQLVPRKSIGVAMSMYGLGVVVAPAVGPVLGGWLVQDVSWRLIFYINVPVGVLVSVGIMTLLPKFPRGQAMRFDVPGFLFVATGLTCLLIAFSEGSTWHWGSYATLLLIAAGFLCLAIFVVIDLNVAEPILDLRLFGNGVFALSALLQALLQIGLFTGAFYTPLFLQQGQQLDAFTAGLTLLPSAVVTTVMMPLSGRLYDRFGPRWPGAIGSLLVAIGTYMLHIITPQMGRDVIIVANCIRNAGVGMALIPVQTGSMSRLPLERINQASPMNNLVGRLSSAMALPLLTTFLTQQQAQQYLHASALLPSVSPGFPDLQSIAAGGQRAIIGLYAVVQNQVFGSGLDDLFLLTAGMSAIGALLALLLPGRSAQPAGGEGHVAMVE
jgi:EmrB/QacA subfamily drug resistance transporter